MKEDARYDAIVVGTGFGGLGAALTLAEAGAKVLVLEALNYPGGCASTFSRDGYRFESGATLFSGLGPEGIMTRWIDRYGLDVEVDWLDPVIELRTPRFRLPVTPRRDELVQAFAQLPGADEAKLRRFFAAHGRLADTLWSLFDDPELLPPLSVSSLVEHARRLPQYLPFARHVGRSMGDFIADYGLADFEPLRIYFDAICQITVQTSAAEAEAPFAIGASDYCFQGTAHVRGGIGQLAHGLCTAIERAGGEVRFASRVKKIRRTPRGAWEVAWRKRRAQAPMVVANLLPQNIVQMTDGLESAALRHLDELRLRVEAGWGAAMLYLVVPPDAVESSHAHHLELVRDPDRPFVEGNHIFCSISAAEETNRAPDGQRTVTVSTHVPMPKLVASPDPARYIGAVQREMQATLEALAPELTAPAHDMTASPRTFERFTGRHAGYVGGIPRRVGWDNYRGMFPRALSEGLYLVGDTNFPGQSTLATALGGIRTAVQALRDHPRIAAQPARRPISAPTPQAAE